MGLLKESDDSDGDDDDDDDETDENDKISDAALSAALQKMITFTHTPTADGGPVAASGVQAPSSTSITGGDGTGSITSPADLYRLFQDALQQGPASGSDGPDSILKRAPKSAVPSTGQRRQVSFGENAVREFDKEQTTRQVSETANTAAATAAAATATAPPGTMQAGIDSPSTAGLLGAVVEHGAGCSAPPDDEAEDRFDRVNHTMEIHAELASRYSPCMLGTPHAS